MTLLAAAMIAALPGAARAQVRTSTESDDLFTPVRAEGEDRIQLHRLLLDLPAILLDLAFVPLMPLVVLDQRYQLGRRLFDLLTSDDRTLALVPLIEPFDTRDSGVGFGALFLFRPKDYYGPDVTLFGLVRTNRDYQIEGRMSQPLVGRTWWLELGAGRELDSDRRFYGTGAGTRESDERRFSDESLESSAEIVWVEPEEGDLSLGASLGVRRNQYDLGRAPTLEPGTGPAPPPGFGRATHLGESRFRAGYDTRDRPGAPSRGLQLDVDVTLARALDDTGLSAVRTHTEVAYYLPVLDPDRVLVFAAGNIMTTPLAGGHEVPFPLYGFLGGEDVLRGYPNDRFAGRYAWWSKLEYRYPIWRTPISDVRLSAMLFGEVGQVADRLSDMVETPLPYSVGIGVRAETYSIGLARVQLAVSPEGVRVSVGLGGLP